jgi:serine/threonine protein kinase/Tfp pilus assembly protein PilF
MTMDPERWQQVEEVFAAALEQPPTARAGVVSAACGDDEALRHEVLSLLEAAEPAAEYFADLSSRAGVPSPADTEIEQFLGRTVGSYRLVRLLGRGGMGVVFLAERDDRQFEKQVALKLLPLGIGSTEAMQRFLLERQILARLEHPGIARLLDGGVTEDGTPYYVMEYVEGLPIDDYCDASRLTVAARLELFLKVCDAVDHAHRHLVVHRDLKPNNILVTSDGEVKLLDFGIARMLDRERSAGGSTVTGQAHPMTLAYASPEQVRGAPITTASDVYSLGVLLYKLLTGCHPYRRDFSSPSDAEQVICGEEPTQPSARVAAADRDERNAVSAARGTPAQRLERALVGDLDTIVLMALRKEPSRRYASVADLAEDLRRHQAGLPVRAHKDSLRYRASRFVRRNRLAVSAGVAVGLLAVALLVLAIRYAVTTAAHGRALTREAEATEEVSQFLVDLFKSADPVEGFGDTVRARVMLDEGAARLEAAVHVRPDIRARMMGELGRVYHNLGLFDEAARLHTEALALLRERYGDTHPAVAAGLEQLADVRHTARDFDAALPLYEEALAIRRRLPDEPEAIAATLQGLARVLRELGSVDSAERLMREALAIRRRELGDAHFHTVWTLLDLAYVLRGQGRNDSAQVLYEIVIPKLQAHGDSGARLLPGALNNLAYIHMAKGEFADAERLYRDAMPLERRWGTVPNLLLLQNNLAGVLDRQNKVAEADSVLRQQIETAEEHWPDGHWRVGAAYGGLGAFHLIRGDTAGAEPYLRRALALQLSTMGDDNPRTTYAKVQLGNCLTGLRRFAEAEPHLREASEWLRTNRGIDNSYTQEVLARLVVLYDRWGRPAQAEQYRRLLSEGS